MLLRLDLDNQLFDSQDRLTLLYELKD